MWDTQKYSTQTQKSWCAYFGGEVDKTSKEDSKRKYRIIVKKHKMNGLDETVLIKILYMERFHVSHSLLAVSVDLNNIS